MCLESILDISVVTKVLGNWVRAIVGGVFGTGQGGPVKLDMARKV